MTYGIRETRKVRLDYPFLLMLTEPGWCWQGESPDRIVEVVAVEGSIDDWTAYVETPQSGTQVAEYGDKLPRGQVTFIDWV